MVDSELETNFTIDVGGQAVGNIGLRIGTDIERYSVEIWYWLGQAHWEYGIVSVALRAMTDYAFTQFKLSRLYTQPMAHNAASIKVLEKAGLHREGLLRDSVVKNGVLMDTVLYA